MRRSQKKKKKESQSKTHPEITGQPRVGSKQIHWRPANQQSLPFTNSSPNVYSSLYEINLSEKSFLIQSSSKGSFLARTWFYTNSPKTSWSAENSFVQRSCSARSYPKQTHSKQVNTHPKQLPLNKLSKNYKKTSKKCLESLFRGSCFGWVLTCFEWDRKSVV